MHYRGGSVGHIVTHHWDDFLQSDGGDIREGREEQGEESEVEDEDEEDEGGEDGEGYDDGDGEGDSKEDSKENEEDEVVGDAGEELDDNVYEQEGYGAL